MANRLKKCRGDFCFLWEAYFFINHSHESTDVLKDLRNFVVCQICLLQRNQHVADKTQVVNISCTRTYRNAIFLF